MKRTFAGAVVLAALFIGWSQTAATNPVKQVPTNAEDCRKGGGNVAHVGLPGSPQKCVITTTDAGKSCADSDECQGICLAPKNSTRGSSWRGTCSKHVVEYSCYNYVYRNGGPVVDRICVE